MKNMLLLKSLRLNNYLSHEETFIEFQPGDKLLVDGASGSGKSTILESIIWALYGEGRSDNRSLVRKGANGGSVELALYEEGVGGNPGRTITLTRAVGPSGKHTLAVSLCQDGGQRTAHALTGLRDLQGWIDSDLIGASYALFINSVAYLQGQSGSFVTQPAPKRKELLLEIVKAGNFETYYERAKDKLSALEVDSKTLVIQENGINDYILLGEDMVSKKPVFQQKKDEATALVAKLEAEKSLNMMEDAKISTQFAQIQTGEDAMKEIQQDVKTIQASIAKANEAKETLTILDDLEKTLDPITAKIAELNDTIFKTDQALIDHMKNQKARTDLMLEKPEDKNEGWKLDKLQSTLDSYDLISECPSGHKCPHQATRDLDKRNCEAEMKDVRRAQEKYLEDLRVWKARYDAIPAEIDLQETIRTHNENKFSRTALDEKRHAIEIKLAQRVSLQMTVKEIPELEQRLKEKANSHMIVEEEVKRMKGSFDADKRLHVTKEKARINRELTEARQVETSAMIDLSKAEELEEKVKHAKEDLDKIKKKSSDTTEAIKKMTLLKEAFGSKGIKTVVIDYLLPDLEKKINDVLGQMSDFRVHLDTQAPTSDGEGVKEGLFITIVNEVGEEMAFENYSGGERLKIVVSISEALATMQKVGFRLFDEVFVGLDENSTESFASVLNKLQAKFNQILCISHLQQVKDTFEHAIMVTKHNGISHVERS